MFKQVLFTNVLALSLYGTFNNTMSPCHHQRIIVIIGTVGTVGTVDIEDAKPDSVQAENYTLVGTNATSKAARLRRPTIPY